MSAKPATQEQWHANRSRNVGASEVAALFGVSPYTSRFTLWHQKAGNIAAPPFESERMEWGNELEPVIAKVLAKRQGWNIRNVKRYMTHSTIKGMGASLDYEIFGQPDGPGCFEIKNLDYASFKRGWIVNEDGSVEAPMHIELQLQHQMAVSGYQWGAFGYLVNGNEGKVVIRNRHEPTIQRIEEEVSRFWASIEKNEVPDVQDSGDLAALSQLFSGSSMVTVEDEKFIDLVSEYQLLQADAKTLESKKEAAKARLIDFIDKQGAEVATGYGYTVSYKQQSRKETVMKASSFRVLRVSEVKGKKDV